MSKRKSKAPVDPTPDVETPDIASEADAPASTPHVEASRPSSSEAETAEATEFDGAEAADSSAILDLGPDVAEQLESLSDIEATVNLSGEFPLPGRDDLEAPTQTQLPEDFDKALPGAARKHLRGLLEALVFVSDRPIKANELAKTASAQVKEVKELLEELKAEYTGRGVQLDEVAGGWIFRTSPLYAPFVRDLTKQKPVKLSRAQIETLAILAYRQPITRPEIDEIRGVDSGPVLKVLLERELVRILGKKDEPGRPLLYGTTNEFLEFFGLKSVKDLPTLREFTELNEDSRRIVEKELGETLESVQEQLEKADATQAHAGEVGEEHAQPHGTHDTIAPPPGADTDPPPAPAEEDEALAEEHPAEEIDEEEEEGGEGEDEEGEADDVDDAEEGDEDDEEDDEDEEDEEDAEEGDEGDEEDGEDEG